MGEALEIMRRLLDGEKLTFTGEYYTTDRAKLYSPPIGDVPIYMAAGGPKSAALAARRAQGIITSVKEPTDTFERVIGPAREAAAAAGRPTPRVLATRWSIHASTEDDAWQALKSWRGLRAPGRLQAVDPQDLRERADELPRDEVLGSYSLVAGPEEIIETYRSLAFIEETTSLDQEATLRRLGDEVLPALRNLS